MKLNPVALVVEDNPVTALDLRDILQGIGFEVCGIARTVSSATKYLEEFSPDLLLLDIVLDEGSGIEIAEQLVEDDHIQTIYLSGKSDEETLSRAFTTLPYAFIRKPYTEADLVIILTICLNNWKKQQAEIHYVRLKSSNKFQLIDQSEIILIQANGSYCDVYLNETILTQSRNLKRVLEKLDPDKFIRVHKSFIVNVDHIAQIRYDQVQMVNGSEIPVGRKYAKMVTSLKKTAN